MRNSQRYEDVIEMALGPKKAAILMESGYFFTASPETVFAYHDDGYGTQIKVGELRYEGSSVLEAQTVNVYEGHQRKGIATVLYCIAESESGGRFIPSKRDINGRRFDNRTPDGRSLWKQRRRPFGRRSDPKTQASPR